MEPAEEYPAEEQAARPARKSFKPMTWAFVASFPILILVSFWLEPAFGAVATCLCLPPLSLALLWWREYSSACPLEHVLSSYGQGFWFLGSVATVTGYMAFSLAQVPASLVVLSLGLPPVLQFTIILSCSLVAFIFVEEIWKANFTRWAMYKRRHRVGATNAHAFVIAGVTASLGHASALSYAFTLLITSNLLNTGDGVISKTEFEDLVLMAFLFALASFPLNVLTAHLAALELQQLTPEQLRIEGHPGPGISSRSGEEDVTTTTAAPTSGPRSGGGAGEMSSTGPSPARGPELCLPASVLRVLVWPTLLRSSFAILVFLALLLLLPVSFWAACILILAALVALSVATVRRARAIEERTPGMRGGQTARRFGFALLADDEDAPAPVDGREASAEGEGGQGGAAAVGAIGGQGAGQRSDVERGGRVGVPAGDEQEMGPVGTGPVVHATPTPSGEEGSVPVAKAQAASAPLTTAAESREVEGEAGQPESPATRDARAPAHVAALSEGEDGRGPRELQATGSDAAPPTGLPVPVPPPAYSEGS